MKKKHRTIGAMITAAMVEAAVIASAAQISSHGFALVVKATILTGAVSAGLFTFVIGVSLLAKAEGET